MKSPKEIQKEIIDNTVISFHEMFKLKQKSDPVLAQEMLSRAIHFARKNYNAESCVVKDLEALLRQF